MQMKLVVVVVVVVYVVSNAEERACKGN